jgi:hypothetical protein
MPSKPRVRRGRKLLVASLGVATISFVGVECSSTSSVANLPAPPSCLQMPQNPDCYGPRPDAGVDAGKDAKSSSDAGPDAK